MKAIERIFKYIEYKKLNKSKLEQKTGISNGYLAKQLHRKADIGESILNAILENCPDVSAEWLLTGKGEMLKGTAEKKIENEKIIELENDIAEKNAEIKKLNEELLNLYRQLSKKEYVNNAVFPRPFGHADKSKLKK